MIDVKQAARVAVESVQNLIGSDIVEPRIEEAELSEDRHHWLITIGFLPPGTAVPSGAGGISAVLRSALKREYKQVLVDSESGDFMAMRIRTV